MMQSTAKCHKVHQVCVILVYDVFCWTTLSREVFCPAVLPLAVLGE